MRGNLGAIMLIVIGVLALITNLGLIELDIAHLLRTWWPMLLILLGIGVLLAPGTDDRRKRD